MVYRIHVNYTNCIKMFKGIKIKRKSANEIKNSIMLILVTLVICSLKTNFQTKRKVCLLYIFNFCLCK
jgi:hypothetical protein